MIALYPEKEQIEALLAGARGSARGDAEPAAVQGARRRARRGPHRRAGLSALCGRDGPASSSRRGGRVIWTGRVDSPGDRRRRRGLPDGGAGRVPVAQGVRGDRDEPARSRRSASIAPRASKGSGCSRRRRATERERIMEFIRTPDERFSDLPDFDHAPHYASVPRRRGRRAAHALRGRRARAMRRRSCACTASRRWCVPLPQDDSGRSRPRGQRVVAPDLIGFGRSDKPLRAEDYSLRAPRGLAARVRRGARPARRHARCQDWGGLVGLRVVAEIPDRFARVVTSNTGLPDGRGIPRGRGARAARALRSVTRTERDARGGAGLCIGGTGRRRRSCTGRSTAPSRPSSRPAT